jgi:hypothetical protein
MTTKLTVRVASTWQGVFAGSPDIGTAEQDFDITYSEKFTDGTAANQANRYYSSTRVINAASSVALDLAGVLADVFGQTITFTTIKGIRVRADDANTANALVGGAASNGWFGCFNDATDIAKVKPGGMFEWIDPSAAGEAVTAGTGDQLKIANPGGAAITVRIEIFGEG